MFWITFKYEACSFHSKDIISKIFLKREGFDPLLGQWTS